MIDMEKENFYIRLEGTVGMGVKRGLKKCNEGIRNNGDRFISITNDQ